MEVTVLIHNAAMLQSKKTCPRITPVERDRSNFDEFHELLNRNDAKILQSTQRKFRVLDRAKSKS